MGANDVVVRNPARPRSLGIGVCQRYAPPRGTVVDDPKPLARAKPARMRRIDEMLAREQIGLAEHVAAVRFQREGDRRSALAALGGYGKLISAVLLNDKPAVALADPRIGRRKGLDEVMRKLRAGLQLLVRHYVTDAPEPVREPSPGLALMAFDRAFARDVQDASRTVQRPVNFDGGWSGRDNFQGFVFLKSARTRRKKRPFIIGTAKISGGVLTVS